MMQFDRGIFKVKPDDDSTYLSVFPPLGVSLFSDQQRKVTKRELALLFSDLHVLIAFNAPAQTVHPCTE